MIVRRLASRRLVKSGSTEEEPRRKRAARFVLAILLAGVLSGVAAWVGIWPFGSVHALIQSSLNPPSQLPAEKIFPPVQPTHRTVDVYDPALQQRSQPPTTAHPTPGTTPQPPPSIPPDE